MTFNPFPTQPLGGFRPQSIPGAPSLRSPTIRHKCFISFHQADRPLVETFLQTFDDGFNSFIGRSLGAYRDMPDAVIRSDNDEYVMSRIREEYMEDSTVTIVMIGKCTWARKYVDWEIKASLRQGATHTPNGLLGIRLPTHDWEHDYVPTRFNANLRPPGAPSTQDSYARHIVWPANVADLASAIDFAFQSRTSRPHLIVNPRGRMLSNSNCGHAYH